jgi:hypothetical protein
MRRVKSLRGELGSYPELQVRAGDDVDYDTATPLAGGFVAGGILMGIE